MSVAARLPLRRLALLALVAACSAALLGCTSSGDGGSDLVDDFLETGALFTSDAPNAGTRPYVQMEQSVDERDRFCVAVSVYQVTNLYSVAFTLQHDPAQATFDASTSSAGSFLEAGSETLIDGTTPGEVIVGQTRVNPIHGMTGVSGEGLLVELCYDVVGDGDGRLTFIPNLALEDATGASVPNGPPIFVGGELSTRL